MKPRLLLAAATITAAAAAVILILLLAVFPASLGIPVLRATIQPPAVAPASALPRLVRVGITPNPGITLQASTGTWTNVPTSFAYQWEDCDATGGIATFTANTNGTTTLSSVSSFTSLPVGAKLSGTDIFAGTTVSTENTGASTLVMSHIATGTHTGTSITTNDCTNIAAATAATYVVQSTDVGRTIRVVVTATNSAGSGSQTSAATGVVTSITGLVTFDQNWEASPFTKPGTPGGLYAGIQAGNWSGQSNGATRFFGDVYVDDGTSTPVTSSGSIFNATSLGTVPAGDGSNSARYVLPIPPTGQCPGCPTGQNYVLEAIFANSPTNTAAAPDFGDRFYGLMFYLPNFDAINSTQIFGITMEEFHFNAIAGAPIGWALHTQGGSAANGTGDSVVLALNTGACNPAVNHTTGANTGCQYRSNADHTQCSLPADPVIGPITCLPGYFAMPPGSVQYGQWNEIVMRVHWAADSTGQIQTFYKTKGQATWTAGANVTGIPTVQWCATGTTSCPGGSGDIWPTTCPPGSPCGYPNHESLESYGGLQSAPWQINYDDQVVGTSLAAVENALPTGGATAIPPANTTPPSASGSTVQGQVLTAANGVWTGTPAPTFTYQWQDCNSSGASCSNITGATSQLYTLTSPDVTHTLKVVVTGTNSAGSASATSAHTAVVTGLSGSPGTGPSNAVCSGGACGAIQLASNSVSVPDGAGKNYNRSIATFYPTGLSGSVPVVIVFGDGQPCSTIAGCVDGAQAFFNIGAAKKFITLRVACTNEQGACAYNTPDVTPYVASIFNKCGTSGTGVCNDSYMVQYLIQTWIPAHIQSWCTGGSCVLDTSRVFVEGGSKGSAMVMQQVCSSLTAPLISGAFADSTTAESATTTASGPPTAAAAAACPYHLSTTPSWNYTPTGNNSHILMMGYENGTVDQPQATSGLLLANGHWQYSEDQQIQYDTGPDYGCGSTFSSQTLTPTASGFSPITGHIYSGCSGSSREAGILITKAGSGGTRFDGLCHAGDCDGLSRDPTTFGNDAFQFGPEMWSFWTTGTLF